MSSKMSFRQPLPLISDNQVRPLWSVMIPTYNCAHYLRSTLESVLQQDLGPEIMQIMVVDDCSTQDDPEAVVQEIGKGRVEFYRQPQNVGMTQNFRTALELSRGYLIHQLHGDDQVRPGFYQKLQIAFESNSEIGAAFSRTISMDEDGHWTNLTDLERSTSGVLPKEWLHRLAIICCILTPSIVVRRAVYEKLGSFDERFYCAAEDWEMWMRIAVNYAIWYEVEPLSIYRTSSASSTGRNILNGRYIEDLNSATKMIHSHLPQPLPEKIRRIPYQNWAFSALGTSKIFIDRGELSLAAFHIRAALRYQISYPVLRSLLGILLFKFPQGLVKSIFG